MAHSSSICPDARMISENEILNLHFNDEIKNMLFARLHEDDMWKLKILLRSFNDIPLHNIVSISSFDEMYNLISSRITDNSELKLVIAELLYTIQRFDLLRLMGSCKHKLKSYFSNADVRKLANNWKKAYMIVEDSGIDESNALIATFLPQIQNRQHPIETSSDRQGEAMSPEITSPIVDPFSNSSDDTRVDIQATALTYPWRPISPCGFCIILNNENFPGSSYRQGSRKDKENLTDMFENFDFEIKSFDDLTAERMKGLLIDYSKKDYSKYDAFACCILSHGIQGKILGVDYKKIDLRNDILNLFILNKNPTLIQKPKLFFVQACQGSEPIDSTENSIEQDDAKYVPAHGDYLLHLATVNGFAAYRSKSKGSWFIIHLTNQLKQFGHLNSLLDCLTEVNRKVTLEEVSVQNEIWKQQPIIEHTLNKRFIFKKKQQPVEST